MDGGTGSERGVDPTTAAWLGRLSRHGERVVIYGTQDDPVTWVSDNFEELLALPADALRGAVVHRLHPDDLTAYLDVQERMAQSGLTIERLLLRVLGDDGSWRRMYATLTNFRDDPELRGVIVELSDIETIEVGADVQVGPGRDTDELLRSQAALRTMVDHVADTLVLVDAELNIFWASPGVTAMIGYRPDEVVRLNGLDLLHPEDATQAAGEFAALLAAPKEQRQVVARLRHKEPTAAGDPVYTWVEIVGRNELDHPELRAVVLSLRDVSDRVAAEQTTERLTGMLDATEDIVVLFDRNFRVTWTNPAGHAVLRDLDAELGVTMPTILPNWVTSYVTEEVIPVIRSVGRWRGELAILDGAGSARPVDVTYLAHRGDDGRVEFMSAIARDITERKSLEHRLAAQAATDTLTGLANRSALMQRLETLLLNDGPGVAIAFVDIDRFKLINDSQGHEIGDSVIATMGHRLDMATREGDLVARFGGDEFVVAWPGVTDLDVAQRLAERLLDDITGPVSAGTSDAYLTASAGVAVGCPGATAARLLSEADAAMYRAKDLGRDRVAAYDEDLQHHVRRKLTVASELRRGLAEGQVVAFYQPVLDSLTRTVVSYEALARWHHPTDGLLAPGAFIDIAEETGIITDLGHVILQHAAETMATRIANDTVSIAVNVSPRGLSDPTLSDQIATRIAAAGLPPSRFVVEVTESLLMADVKTSSEQLHRLRELGLRIAIDDFGTGYSSLAYLEQFPIDILKIDRQFVAPLGERKIGDYSLIAGIIGLSRSLGHVVVAEGVETEAQAEILAELGCDRLQGFLFARPMPREEIDAQPQHAG